MYFIAFTKTKRKPSCYHAQFMIKSADDWWIVVVSKIKNFQARLIRIIFFDGKGILRSLV